ncbi:hypothetical protein [Niallia sp. Krafla_26]
MERNDKNMPDSIQYSIWETRTDNVKPIVNKNLLKHQRDVKNKKRNTQE